MSNPYMPVFVSDYLADTAHLTAAEHGAYMLLIMNYWQRQKPLPADDRKLARIARMSDEEWAVSRDTLAEFFTEHDGEWVHKRIERELSVANEKSSKAKASARASVEARRAKVEQSLSERSTDAELLGEERLGKEDNSSDTDSSTTNVRAVEKSTRPAGAEKFEEFWKTYPSRGQAANPKKPASEKFARAVKAGADPDAIIASAGRYADIERKAGRFGTEKVAQAQTWLHQQRWNDYQTQPDHQPVAPPNDDQWAKRLAMHSRGDWFDHWGPKPGHEGCRVPGDILAIWRRDNGKELAA